MHESTSADGHTPDTPEGLLERHRALATKGAWFFRRRLPRSITFDELHGAALCGLWEAAKGYRAEMGVRFTTYAAGRIRGAILDWLRTSMGSRRVCRDRAQATERLRHDLPDGRVGPDGADAAVRDYVEALCRGLLPDERAVIELRYRRGLTFEAIAREHWGDPAQEAWAHALHQRALEFLRWAAECRGVA